jgi:hypothetical protein
MKLFIEFSVILDEVPIVQSKSFFVRIIKLLSEIDSEILLFIISGVKGSELLTIESIVGLSLIISSTSLFFIFSISVSVSLQYNFKYLTLAREITGNNCETISFF